MNLLVIIIIKTNVSPITVTKNGCLQMSTMCICIYIIICMYVYIYVINICVCMHTYIHIQCVNGVIVLSLLISSHFKWKY